MRFRDVIILVSILAVTLAVVAVCVPNLGTQGLAAVQVSDNMALGSTPAGENPTLPPEIYGPDDFSYYLGSTGNTIEWYIVDPGMVTYEIRLDGVEADSGTLEGTGTVSLAIDGLAIGTYEYVILATGDGGQSYDSVIVTVIPYPSTTVSSPPDVTVLEGAPAFSISWDIYSDYPMAYEIYLDGGLIFSTLWFDNFETVSIRVEGLAVGEYDYTVRVLGQYDEVNDTVHVSVIEADIPPQVSSPLDVTIYFGDAGYSISWDLYDRFPSFFFVTLDDEEIFADAWTSLSQTVEIGLDGLSEGVHEYCIIATNFAGLQTSDCVQVTVLPMLVQEVTLTYTGDLTGTYSDPTYLSALLVESRAGAPVVGREILFVLGTQSAIGWTDDSGVASVIIVLTQPSGIVDLLVSFAGDEDYSGCSLAVSFQIDREMVTLFYTGSTVVTSVVEHVGLQATVFEEADGSLGNLTLAYVTFWIYDASNNLIQVIGSIQVLATDTPGVGVASVETANLPIGNYFIVVGCDPTENLYYSGPASEAVTLTVSKPTNYFITGSGWIEDSSGRKAHFSFVVKFSRDGSIKGHLMYTYKDGKYTYVIMSTEITGMAIDGRHVFFEGYCEILEYVHCKRHPITVMENLRFRVDIWDTRSRCARDVFQIRVTDEVGLVVHEAGVDPLGRVYCGCIHIHKVHRGGRR